MPILEETCPELVGFGRYVMGFDVVRVTNQALQKTIMCVAYPSSRAKLALFEHVHLGPIALFEHIRIAL